MVCLQAKQLDEEKMAEKEDRPSETFADYTRRCASARRSAGFYYIPTDYTFDVMFYFVSKVLDKLYSSMSMPGVETILNSYYSQ